jgi:hypothetical protein
LRAVGVRFEQAHGGESIPIGEVAQGTEALRTIPSEVEQAEHTQAASRRGELELVLDQVDEAVDGLLAPRPLRLDDEFPAGLVAELDDVLRDLGVSVLVPTRPELPTYRGT